MLNLCPECHMPVSDKAEDCPHCGYVFRPRSGSPAAAKAPGRVCDYCKMENPGDVMFCVSCGAPIKVAAAAPSQVQPGATTSAQPLSSGYSQQSSEVKIKYEKTERTFTSQGGVPAGVSQPAGTTAPVRAAVQPQPQRPPVQITPRTVLNFILLLLQWGICLILTLFAVVLATVPSASAIGLAGAAVFACPLIKKLPFRIHPALRALAVFVLFLVAVFTS